MVYFLFPRRTISDEDTQSENWPEQAVSSVSTDIGPLCDELTSLKVTKRSKQPLYQHEHQARTQIFHPFNPLHLRLREVTFNTGQALLVAFCGPYNMKSEWPHALDKWWNNYEAEGKWELRKFLLNDRIAALLQIANRQTLSSVVHQRQSWECHVEPAKV